MRPLIQRFLPFVVVILCISLGMNYYTWNRAHAVGEGLAALRDIRLRTDRQLKHSEKLLIESNVRSRQSIEWVQHSIEREFDQAETLLLLHARQQRPNFELNRSIDRLRFSLRQFIADLGNRQDLRRERAIAHWRMGQLYSIAGSYRHAVQALIEAVKCAEELENPQLVSFCKNTLGCALAMIGEPSQHVFESALEDLKPAGMGSIQHAIELRNLALCEPIRDRRGIELLTESITILEQLSQEADNGFALYIDARMVLCGYCWSLGELRAAESQCQMVIELLKSQLLSLKNSPSISHETDLRRFAVALRVAEFNHEILRKTQSENDPTISRRSESFTKYRWKPLLRLKSEMVPPVERIGLTMRAEFDQQSGFVVPWAAGGWSHTAILQVVESLVDRADVVVAVHDWESFEDAKTSFVAAGLSLERIHFEHCQLEAPWLRDYGPIAATSTHGHPFWLDSCLTRVDMYDRSAMDHLPELIADDFDVQVKPVPIHVEGGMLLTNGRGVVIASKEMLQKNERYGFRQDKTESLLREITGAETLTFVDTLHDEPTSHIDLFMTFVSPETVVVGEIADASDPNSRRLDEISQTLSQITFDGAKLNVVRVPMPVGKDGVFYTYTNVVFANGSLLVPGYCKWSSDYEQQVKDLYQSQLPDWQIVFIESTDLIKRGGALHCLISNLGTVSPLRSDGI